MGLNYVKSENILKIYFLTVDNPCTGVFLRTKEKERKKNNGRIRKILNISISIISGVI